MTGNDLGRLVAPLLAWFRENKRILPWREEVSPYRTWVSEIMLQQTRVEAVKPYFERFIKSLPDISALAECDEEVLMKLWEGLGYYSRVRNMQAAARTVMDHYGGELPADYGELLKLKGIGEYTAGAIASIAYGIPVPAVDGNVFRVITRVTGDSSNIAEQAVKTKIRESLLKVMPKKNPGDFNQALMELGATVCVPNGEAQCHRCPWQNVCRAKEENRIEELPVKPQKRQRRIENKTVFIIKKGDRTALCKRKEKGLLAGLYEFPNTAGTLSGDEALKWLREKELSPLYIKRVQKAKHIFSHVEWHMTGYVVWLDELAEGENEMLFAEAEEIKGRYALPAAFHAYLQYVHMRPEDNFL